ncbi:MAG: aminotransferase class I/II-fold pyridoxal phosphate-dependent enzyme, partial [Victivallaceae bacterium]|nr:aminotransferase class I/II-fold pyridoxal phosphate-dependent enzyme [Victivallaceae bacterium]
PAPIIDAMMKIHQYAIMCAPTMAQEAALEALRRGVPAMEEMRESYRERRNVIVDGFNRIGLNCLMPKGAFYAFPSIGGTGMSSEEFAEKLLTEEKVAVIPGNAFGACGEGFVRCCYATGIDDIYQALERMERFVKRHNK